MLGKGQSWLPFFAACQQRLDALLCSHPATNRACSSFRSPGLQAFLSNESRVGHSPCQVVPQPAAGTAAAPSSSASTPATAPVVLPAAQASPPPAAAVSAPAAKALLAAVPAEAQAAPPAPLQPASGLARRTHAQHREAAAAAAEAQGTSSSHCSLAAGVSLAAAQSPSGSRLAAAASSPAGPLAKRTDPAEAAPGAAAVAREPGHVRRPSAARQSLQTYCVSASSDGTVRASAVDPGAVHFDSMEGAQHASMVTEEGDEVHVVVRPMRASGES